MSMKNGNEEKTQPLVSALQLQVQSGQVTSEDLPRSVCEQLAVLMVQVTKDQVTPTTVNAACNCASQIQKILRFNFDMQREERKAQREQPPKPKEVSVEAKEVPVPQDKPRKIEGLEDAPIHMPLNSHITAIEIQRITSALQKTGGNISAAARDLGMLRSTLYEKMKKLGIAR